MPEVPYETLEQRVVGICLLCLCIVNANVIVVAVDATTALKKAAASSFDGRLTNGLALVGKPLNERCLDIVKAFLRPLAFGNVRREVLRECSQQLAGLCTHSFQQHDGEFQCPRNDCIGGFRVAGCQRRQQVDDPRHDILVAGLGRDGHHDVHVMHENRGKDFVDVVVVIIIFVDISGLGMFRALLQRKAADAMVELQHVHLLLDGADP
mmetsp:Transcript_3290/g.9355  ORF Transcript_3290/g.9355 Transcript_3290/m.9355 type:complete len:209 (+) Transcript_3290:277-903(+)